MEGFLKAKVLAATPHGFSTAKGLTAADVLPGSVVVRLRQVHSASAVTVTGPWEQPPEADALVTARRGLALSIVTADCAPVLLADLEANVVGAAHAGWRGAVGGVIENTIGAMVSLGAQRQRIRAAIGPTIAQDSYEVDLAFRERFDEDDARFFSAGEPGHYQFDLSSYVAHRLNAAGVGQVEDLQQDTYTQPDRFFSYRRATHRGEANDGRQVSIIALPT